MEGLGRAAGSGIPIEFGGETLILPPLLINDLGIVEQHLLQHKPSPLEEVVKVINHLSEDKAMQLVDRAYEDSKKLNTVSADEVAAYIDSVEGLIFTVWLALQKRYGSRFSKDDVGRIVQAMDYHDLARLRRARDQASGLDERGNWIGPASETEVKPGVATVGGRYFARWLRAPFQLVAGLVGLRKSSRNGRSTN